MLRPPLRATPRCLVVMQNNADRVFDSSLAALFYLLWIQRYKVRLVIFRSLAIRTRDTPLFNCRLAWRIPAWRRWAGVGLVIVCV